uniref:Putative secreted peptide n=1 Tax=Rhipicephalus pulchellus TaxID=72859 RepID=L7MCC8_RHIPC
MRIACVALTLVTVAIVYLELQLAEGKLHLKVPKLKLKSGMRVRVPKLKKTRIRVPKVRHVGRTIGHAALGTTNVVSSLGTTGANIAQTVLNNQNGQKEQASSR